MNNKTISLSTTMSFSGDSLKKARVFKGLTLSELANEINVSPQVISKYEKNYSIPSFEVLQRISKELNFPVQYFYNIREVSEDSDGFFRKGSTVSKKNKSKVIELASYANEILDVIEQQVFLPKYRDPVDIKRTVKYSPIDNDYIENIAIRIRNKFNFSDGPLINLTSFLETLGIVVIFADMSSEKIDAYTIYHHKRPMIIINSRRTSSSRIRFNLAHEFAHILLHRDYDKKYENGGKFITIEDEANYFAGCFLLPEQGLLQDLSSVNLQHFIALKSHWRVSIAAIVTRANQCGFISDSHTLHLRQQISRNKWRIKEPLDDEIPIEMPVILEQAIEIYSQKVQAPALEYIGKKLGFYPEFISNTLFGHTLHEVEKPLEAASNLKLITKKA